MLPDESGKCPGSTLFGGSMLDTQQLLHFMESVTHGVNVYSELVGYHLRRAESLRQDESFGQVRTFGSIVLKEGSKEPGGKVA